MSGPAAARTPPIVIGVLDIVRAWRTVNAATPSQVHLQIPRSATWVDWVELPEDGSMLPSLPFGQKSDSRIPLARGSLHVHWYDEVVRVHVDRYDPKRAPIRHLTAETGVVGAGLVVGGLAAIATGPIGGLIFGLGASALEARFPRSVQVWTLDLVDGSLVARRDGASIPIPEAGGTCPNLPECTPSASSGAS